MSLSPAKLELLNQWRRGQLSHDATTIPVRPLHSPVSLSFPQQRQLFLELLEPGTAVNNLSVFFELNGKLDPGALEQSANRIIARHEVLRTRFCFGTGLPVPDMLTEIKITIPVTDLTQMDEAAQMDEARRFAETEVVQPFNLMNAPLIRLRLYVFNSRRHQLLVLIHHTIADGWSLGVFLQELMMHYQSITTGTPVQLPRLPIQYADYACWQTQQARVEAMQPSLHYWKKQLGGELPVLELPTDEQRGPRQTFSGGTFHFVLPAEVTEALEKICRQEDATLFMGLLTAFYMLLHRYSGQDEILVGTPIANRNQPELEHLIGVFINTLVLRTSLSGDPSFRDLLSRVRAVCLDAYAHQDLPFEKLVEALKPKRDLSRTPFFQVVFNLQNAPMPKLAIPGLEIHPIEINRGLSQFDLTLMMAKSGGQCHAMVEYNSDLFHEATIARMFESFRLLLEDAVADTGCPMSVMRINAKEELHHMVHTLNQTQFEFPRHACMHQLFEAQAAQTPDAIAVVYQRNSRTYSELNQQANVLAKQLHSSGVGPGTRVGIFMDRSIELVEALLAVLKAGGTYVPIHTSFPAARVQFMLDDAGVQVLLTNVDTAVPATRNIRVLNLNHNNHDITTGCDNPYAGISPDQPAYIMYTSGSTGQPKGVMVQHSALVNFLCSIRVQPGITKDDVLLAVTSITFDIAGLELFLPLITGATVVIAGKDMTTNPFLLADAINQHKVTLMQATPATWQMLINAGWAGSAALKALCGGDVLTRKLADQLLERVGSLWNMYGPTETTIWSAICQLHKDDKPVTIGRPIGNTQLYILDNYLHPVPVGVTGELHIGGDGVARGYLNLPGLTNTKFIPDPFSSGTGPRLYKTGDSARYLQDYSIELLGRMDDQVKLNGQRIELGEIAALLVQHPAVQEAIVLAHKEGAGEKRLVAYYVPSDGQPPDNNVLQDFLRQKLPGYMIPFVYITMQRFPLTPNGKIDRNALPLSGQIRQLPGYVAPRNSVEQILAGIWQEVLGIQQVGIEDNFFDLGGASIQSIQIVANANISGLRITVEHIFEYQTIAELAAFIQRE